MLFVCAFRACCLLYVFVCNICDLLCDVLWCACLCFLCEYVCLEFNVCVLHVVYRVMLYVVLVCLLVSL